MGESVDVGACGNCGAKIVRGTTSCPRCKARINYPPVDPLDAPLTPETTKRTLLATLAVLSVCAVGLFGLFRLPAALDSAKTRAESEQRQSDLRADAGKAVSIGMSDDEVRGVLGAPDSTQEFNSASGHDETWYYGQWQLVFRRGRLESTNRY